MKRIKKAIIIIILVAGVGTTTFFVGRQIGLNTDTSSTNTTIEEVTVGTQNIKKNTNKFRRNKNSQYRKISNINIILFWNNVCWRRRHRKKGEDILKYTNGTYLVAPYDSVITEMSKISSVSLGQSASVSISTFEDKTLEGVVTNISSTASNGKFTVTVEFDNDGDVMLGMTAGINI